MAPCLVVFFSKVASICYQNPVYWWCGCRDSWEQVVWGLPQLQGHAGVFGAGNYSQGFGVFKVPLEGFVAPMLVITSTCHDSI